ncbi:MAG: type IV secretion system DNA-binding domain-containing protein [Planctomycetia bacterium]|nr:type IV secretion system DNA-binding domain-containing protein [Planctomycetia bacterium]
MLRFAATPMGSAVIVMVIGITGVVFPGLLLFSILAPLVMLAVTHFLPSLWTAQLPLRLPLDEAANERIDYGDPKPQHKGYNKARGAFLIGAAWRNKEEVWAAFTDILTHCLVIGGTGAGKTEQLISMLFNALACAGGGLYVDPKGGPKLVGQFGTMARFCGRDDDLRILNFALGQEEMSPSPFIRSNTLQPFAFGKADSLKELPLSLMSGGEDKGSVFSSNGKTLMTGLMFGLVDLRKMGEIYLTINDIRTYINSDKYIELALRKDISSVAREAMQSFLVSLGWKEGVTDRTKWGDFDRQYSYAQNYFLDSLSVMSDTYRHIFNVPIGDINMVDIILNRRMFLCVIPSLEKSKKELSSLGKITLAVIRLATAVGLGGGEIMGNWKELVDLTVSASEVPSFLFVDEYAAIAVDGFAEVFTQGRSLGISATIGSQDWAGIKKANEAEAQQIVANTKLKFIMTTDDPNDTQQLITSLAQSDDEEIRSQGFSMGTVNYYDNQSAQSVKASRIDRKDLSGQVEGEWHLFFKNRIIRGYGFFAGGVPDDENSPLFVHHLLMVERPKYTTLSAQFGVIKETIDRWIVQIQQSTEAAVSKTAVGETRTSNTFQPDYTDMEGCIPLGAVFEATRLCNEVNAHGVPGLASKPLFSVLNRRETVCAAIYAWIEENQQIPQCLKEYAEALERDARKKLASPQSSRQQVETETNRHSASSTASGSAQVADRPPADDGFAGDGNYSAGDAAKDLAAQPPTPSDDDPDDLLAGMERQMFTSANKPSGAETAEAAETIPESSGFTGATERSVSDEMPSVDRFASNVVPDEQEGLPPASMDRARMAAHDFSGLSQFVEESLSASEKPLRGVVEASSQKETESEKKAESQEAVRVVKDHMIHVLTEPPYPSPPIPEPIEASRFRNMAERWIKQVKDQ